MCVIALPSCVWLGSVGSYGSIILPTNLRSMGRVRLKSRVTRHSAHSKSTLRDVTRHASEPESSTRVFCLESTQHYIRSLVRPQSFTRGPSQSCELESQSSDTTHIHGPNVLCIKNSTPQDLLARKWRNREEPLTGCRGGHGRRDQRSSRVRIFAWRISVNTVFETLTPDCVPEGLKALFDM